MMTVEVFAVMVNGLITRSPRWPGKSSLRTASPSLPLFLALPRGRRGSVEAVGAALTVLLPLLTVVGGLVRVGKNWGISEIDGPLTPKANGFPFSSIPASPPPNPMKRNQSVNNRYAACNPQESSFQSVSRSGKIQLDSVAFLAAWKYTSFRVLYAQLNVNTFGKVLQLKDCEFNAWRYARGLGIRSIQINVDTSTKTCSGIVKLVGMCTEIRRRQD